MRCLGVGGGYTAKNAKLASSVLRSCNRLVINKPISGYVRMAFDILLTTSLLQVDCQNLLFSGLLQIVSTSCNKSANGKFQQT